MFLSLGELCIQDQDSDLCQFLQLSDRRLFQETLLVEAKLQIEEIYLPLYNSGGKMDQNWKKPRP